MVGTAIVQIAEQDAMIEDQEDPEYPELLTVPEVAEILRVSEKTVYSEISKKNIPAIRYGRLIRVPSHALLERIRNT